MEDNELVLGGWYRALGRVLPLVVVVVVMVVIVMVAPRLLLLLLLPLLSLWMDIGKIFVSWSFIGMRVVIVVGFTLHG